MKSMDIDRRALLARAFLLAGAMTLPSAEVLAAAVSSDKRQLDSAHFALLTAVSDTIIPKDSTPGAVEAGVPQVVDAMLGSWASPERKMELLAALDKIDLLAKRQHKRGFASLSPAERKAVLAPHDQEALKSPPPPPPGAVQVGANASKLDPNNARLKQEPALSELFGPKIADSGYGKLKELIVVAFYYSETALTHDLGYEHSPGEWIPSVPVTPQTRAQGGAGFI